MSDIPIESVGTLAVLALTDSMSIGTMVIPLWFLTTPGRPRVARIALYLATVMAAYVAVGAALVLGGRVIFERGTALLSSPPVLVAQLLLGAALVIVSCALDTKAARARAAARPRRAGRLVRWRDRAMGRGDDGTPHRAALAAIVLLALLAVGVEIASMLPYLVATGIIAAHVTTPAAAIGTLVAYCAVMIAPAVALTIARLAAGDAIEAPLRRGEAWLTRHSRSTTLWIVGIAGVLLGAGAFDGLRTLGD
ncbi:GAP family protein [Microbacterium sp. SORGH_AS_0888]|uniref:GAP family protein n=1 Tax=Microbacterium sp. SORGH_AS_0888 TaxID=3041791 RepID=UPI00277FFA5C|nr:GAP family protein [Microbacterium sp. SORGH_AS_0888]MDQ1128341.1 hypothetical protein [Microbacterium sp. SORGH_AS_0888]